VPLVARGRTVGAFTFGMSVSDRTYAQADIALAEELGQRAGTAVDNAWLFRDAVRARTRAEQAEQRMMRLQETTEVLARVMNPHEAGAAILAQLVAVFGAAGGSVYRREDDRLELLATSRPDEAIDPGQVLVLPLTTKGEVIGSVALELSRELSTEDRVFADAIAWQCTLALDRSLLVARERQNAELSAFLGAASDLLAVSREPEDVFVDLVRLVVPRYADWCSLDLIDPERIRQVAFGHRDPVKLQWVEALRRKYSFEHCGIHTVIRTGRSVLHEHVTPEIVAAMAVDGEHRDILEKLAIRSVIQVPLIASGKPLGSMTLAWSEPSAHVYTREDLELFEELAHRAALAVDNVRLYRDLKQAVQVRDDFLAAAGHELKTPLAALLMHIESIERQLQRGVVPANLAVRLEKAGRAGIRLERLIDELLDVSRITAGRLKLEPEPVQLDELVREVIERFTDQAVSAACPIAVVAQPVAGIWDRLRIDQVVSNLVANALKYGRGRPVEIAVDEADDHATVRVTDHGIGIAAAQQVKIFERFERAVESRAFGGFGLGLWIARQIVEASHGTIEVTSAPDEGATFCVRLPLGPRE
ncbi:MAG TPA: GAF domain-containing sensor histidine kinase, partial [Kofleriaceae bacterium]